MIQAHMDRQIQNVSISVWMQAMRRKEKSESASTGSWWQLASHGRENLLENTNCLKKQVVWKKQKQIHFKSETLSRVSWNLLKQWGVHDSICICAHIHISTQLYQYNHNEFPPTRILFLFFNVNVFFHLKVQ